MLLTFCDWRGAKGCKSDISRQELSNEYSLSLEKSTSHVGKAENEPRRVLIKDFVDHILTSYTERVVAVLSET